MGDDVVALYLDGAVQPVEWRRLANYTDTWVHVHMELGHVTERITYMMCRFDGTRCLAGRVSEVRSPSSARADLDERRLQQHDFMCRLGPPQVGRCTLSV